MLKVTHKGAILQLRKEPDFSFLSECMDLPKTHSSSKCPSSARGSQATLWLYRKPAHRSHQDNLVELTWNRWEWLFFSGVHSGYSYTDKKLMACRANVPSVHIIFVSSLESVQAQGVLLASDTWVLPGLHSCSNVGICHHCWTRHRAPVLSKKDINVVLNTHMASTSVTPTPLLDKVFDSWPVSQDCAVQVIDLHRS